jgi:hypothetical protein
MSSLKSSTTIPSQPELNTSYPILGLKNLNYCEEVPSKKGGGSNNSMGQKCVS